MGEFNALNIYAGLTAYCVAILLGAGPLMFLAYKLDIGLTMKTDEVEQLKAGKRAVGIELGAMLVCQAILIRHAVPAVMDVIRTLFAYKVPAGETLALIGRSGLFALLIIVLSWVSVWIAGTLFAKMTQNIQEKKEIHEKDNVAVAIFYALVLFAITLVLNEGMHELARSFVPFGRTGAL